MIMTATFAAIAVVPMLAGLALMDDYLTRGSGGERLVLTGALSMMPCILSVAACVFGVAR